MVVKRGICFSQRTKYQSILWFVTCNCQSNSSGISQSLLMETLWYLTESRTIHCIRWHSYWDMNHHFLNCPRGPSRLLHLVPPISIQNLKYLKDSERMKMKVKCLWIQNETWISLSGMAEGDGHLELPRTRFVTARMLAAKETQEYKTKTSLNIWEWVSW